MAQRFQFQDDERDSDSTLSLVEGRVVAEEDRWFENNLHPRKKPRIEAPVDEETDAEGFSESEHEAITSTIASPTVKPLPPDNVVCFGKLPLQISLSAQSNLLDCDSAVEVEDGKLWDSKKVLLGSLPPRETELIELFQESAIDVEIHKTTARSFLTSSQKTRKQPLASVCVVLYGRKELGDPLNEVLETADLFLQDPVGALRDEVYWNPQRMFNDPDRRTSSLVPLTASVERREVLDPKDFLSSFTSDRQLEETEGSQAVVTPLLPHQKQALTFCLARERSWQLTSGRDVWTFKRDETAAGQSREFGSYMNEVTQEFHREPPPDFRGGIIADTMGSGKSLAMIALVAHDMVLSNHDADQGPTLFVVPSQLLGTWNAEFSKHIHPGALTWLSRYKNHKSALSQQLEKIDIVLTTYDYLARTWSKEGKSNDMFSRCWKRIILDEAHYIKNQGSLRAQAVYHLKSERRWAVTGTPIQNNLPELHSLLRFLRAFPYDDKAVFDDHIQYQWASGRKHICIERLKRLLDSVMLRRVGQHIDLPARTDVRIPLEFTPSERQAYKSAAEKALKFIDDALESTSCSRSGSYLNAVQKITTLRRICNHGTTRITQHDQSIVQPDDSSWNSSSALASIRNFNVLGPALICHTCHRAVDEDREVHLTECLRVYCTPCSYSNGSVNCGCQSPCPIADVDLSETAACDKVASPGSHQLFEDSVYPTKICALLEDLQKWPAGTKSIVFSSWTSTLDLARDALSQAGIVCEQVDGRVTPKERESIFARFQRDNTVQVLLLSLSCGAVGLTLTAATRAYLMEPQWNPSIEEQALARIHRIGQSQAITTVRFFVESTIEECILRVQERKNDLVQALLLSSSRASKSILKELRSYV